MPPLLVKSINMQCNLTCLNERYWSKIKIIPWHIEVNKKIFPYAKKKKKKRNKIPSRKKSFVGLSCRQVLCLYIYINTHLRMCLHVCVDIYMCMCTHTSVCIIYCLTRIVSTQEWFGEPQFPMAQLQVIFPELVPWSVESFLLLLGTMPLPNSCCTIYSLFKHEIKISLVFIKMKKQNSSHFMFIILRDQLELIYV